MQTEWACILIPTSPSHRLPSDIFPEGSWGKLRGAKPSFPHFNLWTALPKRSCVKSSALSCSLTTNSSPFCLFWTTSRVWTTVFTSLFHIQPVSKLFKNRNHGFYFWTSPGRQTQSGWCWVSAEFSAGFPNQVRCTKRFLLEKLWVTETQVRGYRTGSAVSWGLVIMWHRLLCYLRLVISSLLPWFHLSPKWGVQFYKGHVFAFFSWLKKIYVHNGKQNIQKSKV